MPSMLFGILCIVLAVWNLVLARKCRHDPSSIVDWFSTDSGAHRSVTAAMFFLGNGKAAKEEFLQNHQLQRYFLMEKYLTALLALVAGVSVLF